MITGMILPSKINLHYMDIIERVSRRAVQAGFKKFAIAGINRSNEFMLTNIPRWYPDISFKIYVYPKDHLLAIDISPLEDNVTICINQFPLNKMEKEIDHLVLFIEGAKETWIDYDFPVLAVYLDLEDEEWRL